MKKKILFTYTNFSTFVKTDFEILASEHEVSKYQFKPVKGLLKTACQFFKQLFYLTFNIWKFDIVFIWFADYHSYLPVLFAKIFSKKSFVVIGGYDICRMPILNYGVFVSKFRGFFAFQSMKFSTCNLSVSNYVDRKVKWILPKAKTQLIYNSVRLTNDIKDIQKKDIVLTVGLIDNTQTFMRKGIDTFFEVAKLLPEYKFIVIGIDPEKFQTYLSNISDNIIFYQRVEQNELKRFYAEAKIYAQFSRMDTFCLTLAEAMLFGCYPVITNEGGMPEVVGKCGRIVNRNDIKSIADLIQKSIIEFQNVRENKKQFLVETRKKLLLELFH